MPHFYKECINYFQELNRKGRAYMGGENEIIWGNNNVLFNGKPLMFSHWSKSGIISFSDIIEDGKLMEEKIYNALLYRAGYFFELQTIKFCFKRGYFNKERLDDQQRSPNPSLLKTNYRMPDGKFKTLEELTSKDLYDILLYTEKVHIPSQEYWSNRFEEMTDKWDEWFQMNWVNELLPRKCKDFNWKLFHGQVNTESRLHRMSMSDGKCKLCNKYGENVDHMLFECNGLFQIWESVERMINTTCNVQIDIDLFCVLSGFVYGTDTYNSKLVNVVISITRWEIWKRRNTGRYEDKLIPINSTIHKILQKIKYHARLLIRKHKSTAVQKLIEW